MCPFCFGGLSLLVHASCSGDGIVNKGRLAWVCGTCRASFSRGNFETNGLLECCGWFFFYVQIPVTGAVESSVGGTVGPRPPLHPLSLSALVDSDTPRCTCLCLRHSPPPEASPCQCEALLGTSSLPSHPPNAHTTEMQAAFTLQGFFRPKDESSHWIDFSTFTPGPAWPCTQSLPDSSKPFAPQTPRIELFEPLRAHFF